METFVKQQPKDKITSLFKGKKKVILITLAVVFFLASASLVLLSLSPKKTAHLPSPTPLPSQPSYFKPPLSPKEKLSFDLVPTPSSPLALSPSKGSIPSLPSNLPPKISFEKYDLATVLPQLSSQIALYTFKTDYSDEEVKNFAAQFGFFNLHSLGDYILAKNITSLDTLGFLLFNKKNGQFTFYSFGAHQPALGTPENPVSVAENFLKEKGLLDETIAFHATYQKKGFEEITFVEFHRDWEKAGLPILNLVGLLNLDETIRLVDFRLGEIDPKTPNDPNIFNTSDGYNGRSRPNDFNTITVAVSNAGTILSIESNLRQLEGTDLLTPQNTNFLTPKQALTEIQQGKGLFKLTTPSGEGITDLRKVYPQNLAQASQAMATDFVLAYLEKPPTTSNTQIFLQPVYLFKGYATLDSGYRVNWVQAIPAIADTQISLPEVLGEETIKLGTFTPTPSPHPPTPTPSLPSPSPSPTPPPSPCIPNEADFDPIYDLAGLGQVGQCKPTGRRCRTSEWYFIPSQDQALPNLVQLLAEFEALNLEYRRLRQIEEIRDDWQDPNCPKRLTGGSPTLFVYAPEGTSLTIKPKVDLTYADPPLTAKAESLLRGGPAKRGLLGWWDEANLNDSEVKWQITITDDNQLNINGLFRPFIYYEYEPITFTKPDKGWLIKKSNLETFARKTLSPQLGLTPLEEDRLVFELNHASFDLDAETVFVGLIDQKEINQKLPLEISVAGTPGVTGTGSPDVEKSDSILRYHFYLSQFSSSPSLPSLPSPPQLTPISRSDFMVLELGAVSQ